MSAKLHIQIAERNGISFLKESFYNAPFKIANITESNKKSWLQLVLMSSSPGILDGDEYDIKIHVKENASLHLHTQAYQRLFRMKEGATQQLTTILENGASFIYLPHPCVPHQDASFTSYNDFFLENNHRLVFGEVLTCGRKLNGESFVFSKYHSINRVFINKKLWIKENMLIQPAVFDINSIGQLEGFSHQASMLILHSSADLTAAKNKIIHQLSCTTEIEWGVTAAPTNGLIIRLLGNGAEKLYQLLHQAVNCLDIEFDIHTTSPQPPGPGAL